MKLTKDDEEVIFQYIRMNHKDYTGPVFINMDRLKKLNLLLSRFVVEVAIAKAKIAHRGS